MGLTLQEGEIKLRESEANKTYDNYFDTLSKRHSIPVMDREVKLFCNRMPKNAKIIDVGGVAGASIGGVLPH